MEKSKPGRLWVEFYEPILKKYVNELIDNVKRSNIVYDADDFLKQVISALLSQLNSVAYQTIIAEIYYAKKNNILKGNTKEERGRYFSDVLLRDNKYIKEIYIYYPELIRILDSKVEQCISFIIKIINDTNKEMRNIEKKLNLNKELGKIKEIHMGEGDTHNNGKTVVKLIFENNRIIMYKPRNMKVDKSYYDFIQWINNLKIINNDKEKLVAAKVYTKNDVGWVEFIEYRQCDNIDDIKRFYYRMGRLLCLIYSLNGNDMHFENVIANKDMPVLIDLETIMHPNMHSDFLVESATERAIKLVTESVIATHLLPAKIVNNDKVLEIGGLGAITEQQSPFRSKFIDGYGSDEVKIIKEYGKIRPKNNNPFYNGEVVDAKKYKNQIISGFEDMYMWILKNKGTYISKISNLFGNSKVRVLYRPTSVYAQLLFSSFHPDLLTNGMDRYIFLHRIAINYNENNKEIISLEIKDLMNGDVPHFTIDSDKKEINHMNLSNININSKESIIETISKKVKNMTKVGMYHQIRAIKTTFIDEYNTPHFKAHVKFLDSAKRKYNKDFMLNITKKIADYMLEYSITGEKDGINSRTWLSSEDTGLGFYVFKNCGLDIYSGLAGIALLYHYIGEVSNESKYKIVVREIVQSIIEDLPKDEELKYVDTVNIGAFNGLSGIAYVLFYIDEFNELNTYTKEILNILDIINENVENTEGKDIISMVGTLGVLISIYKKTKNVIIKKQALEISEKIFEILDRTKITIKNKGGVTWSKKGYVGYAHGNAGIIAQLYRLYTVINEDKVIKLINEALIYEREMYSSKNKNWYRAIDEKNFSNAWCHGAAGILLSKIQTKKLEYKNHLLSEEIEIAIERIKKAGLNNDIGLCHGDIGNLSILKEAAINLNDKDLYDKVVCTIEEILDFILKLMETEAFKSEQVSGFMLGLSGIGYEILRIGRENEIPNILGLE